MYRKHRMWRDLILRFGTKTVILTMALVIVISGTLSGSLAWLTAQTAPIKNVFTIGDIDIKLDETTGTDYEMEMGSDLAKDPKVTVLANSKKCWVYVKIDLSENFTDFLSFETNDGWKFLEKNGNSTVYYLEKPVEESRQNQEFYVLKGKGSSSLKNGYVSVHPNIDEALIDEVTSSGNYPSMTLTAYAVQWGPNAPINTAETAWNEIRPIAGAADSNAVNEAAVLPELVSQPATKENPFLAENSSEESEKTTSMNYADRMALQAEEAWIAFATGGSRS